MAEEVGERFACVQAGGEGVQRLNLGGLKFGVVDALRGGREAGDVRSEVAGFDGGDFGVGMGGDGLGEGQGEACPTRSRRRRRRAGRRPRRRTA